MRCGLSKRVVEMASVVQGFARERESSLVLGCSELGSVHWTGLVTSLY